MSAEYFLDTNVFIYSFDASAPTKKARAMDLVERALIEGTGVISWQVVQEFLNVALHKWEVTLTHPDALEFLAKTSGFQETGVTYESPFPSEHQLQELPAQQNLGHSNLGPDLVYSLHI